MLGAFCLSACLWFTVVKSLSLGTSGPGFGKPTREAGWSFFGWAAAGICNAQKRFLSPLSGPSHVLGTQLLAQGVCSGRC